MKPFGKVSEKVRGRMSQKERGQYGVMKRNQRKARRRLEHVEDNMPNSILLHPEGFIPSDIYFGTN